MKLIKSMLALAAAVFIGTSAQAEETMNLTAFSAEKIYDGFGTNATYTVDQEDATITVSYGGSEEGPFDYEEEYDPVKFKDCVDTWARFTATKEGYQKAVAIAYVRITSRPVNVTAPNLAFTLDADDDAIDAEIESNINIEKAGLNPERGILEGDKITYKWAREEGSYDGSREEDVSYAITFPDYGEYEDYNVTYQGNYEVCYVPGTLKFPKPPAIDLMAGDTAPVITTTETALKWWVEKNDAADKYLTVTVERQVDATAKLTITAKGTDEAAEPAVIKLFGDNKPVKTITVNVLAKEDYDHVGDLAKSIMIGETWSYTTVATSDTDNWSIAPDSDNYKSYDLSKMDGYFTNNGSGTSGTSRSLTRNDDGTVTLEITGVAPNGSKTLIIDLKRGNEVVQKFQIWVVEAVQDVHILKGETVRKTGSYNKTDGNRRWVTNKAFYNASSEGTVGLSLKNGNNEFQQESFTYTETYPDYKYNTTRWNTSFNADLKGNEVGNDVVLVGRYETGSGVTSFSPCFRYNVYVYEQKEDSFELKAGVSTNLTCKSEVAGAWEATSSDPTIATVTEAGWSATEFKPTIMALKKGEATLTIKNIYCTYTVTVTVTQGLETENLSVEMNKTVERKIEGGVTVETTADSIAKIALGDQEGTNVFINAVAPGDATCTVKDESGNEIYQYIVKVSETKTDKLTVMLEEYKDYSCKSVNAAQWKAESSDPGVVKVVNEWGEASTEFELKLLGVAEGTTQVIVKNDYVVYTIEVTVQNCVAEVGGKKFESLAKAVAAANDGDTVTLLSDAAGDGIKIEKSITIDFGGFTYTVDAALVGSPSTQSQAFNLVKGNAITLKNGTITSTVARMLVQNYASLTLDNMVLDGENLAAKNGKGNDYVAYTLSNCAGDTVITGDSVIKARVLEGQVAFAFDTYYKAGKYEDATVEVNGATIYGDVELAGGSLTLTAGTLNGALVEGANIEKGTVTKEDAFEADAPSGWEWDDGVLVKSKSTITIKIEKGEYILNVMDEDGQSVGEELELPAGTTVVKLQLEPETSLNVPVYKWVKNNETNVTTKVATYYDIADGDTLEFFAVEADETDPDVTDDQIKQAIIDAFDDDVDAVKKVNAIVDTSVTPAQNKISARELAAWIHDNGILSSDFGASDYVVASAKLKAEMPITDENTEIEFVNGVSVTADGFVFDVSIVIDGRDPLELDEKMTNIVAACIQTTENLGTGFSEEKTVDVGRVEILDGMKVLIKPAAEPKSAEFFQFVIPPDPGAQTEIHVSGGGGTPQAEGTSNGFRPPDIEGDMKKHDQETGYEKQRQEAQLYPYEG